MLQDSENAESCGILFFCIRGGIKKTADLGFYMERENEDWI